ncbi:MAG: hypothetical protein M1826_004630 [Phylliscum demangeonii]|nr:MAG: hypothetical protein M1826_004630 [Phylliscum demangeonii]
MSRLFTLSTLRQLLRRRHPRAPPRSPAPILQRLRPRLGRPSALAMTVASTLGWIPIWIFATEHVAQVMTVQGPSMAPALSPDYHAAGRRDRVWARMYQPTHDLRRGTVVAFWWADAFLLDPIIRRLTPFVRRSPLDAEKLLIKRVVALEGDVVRTRCPPYPLPEAQVPVAKALIVAQITHVLWPWARAGHIRAEDWTPSRPGLVLRHVPLEMTEA